MSSFKLIRKKKNPNRNINCTQNPMSLSIFTITSLLNRDSQGEHSVFALVDIEYLGYPVLCICLLSVSCWPLENLHPENFNKTWDFLGKPNSSVSLSKCRSLQNTEGLKKKKKKIERDMPGQIRAHISCFSW